MVTDNGALCACFYKKKSLLPYSDVHDMVTDYGALFWCAYL
jgi:hypothetical protein